MDKCCGIRFRLGVTVGSRLTSEQKDKINQHWIEKDISNFLRNYKSGNFK